MRLGPFVRLRDFRFGELRLRVHPLGSMEVLARVDAQAVFVAKFLGEGSGLSLGPLTPPYLRYPATFANDWLLAWFRYREMRPRLIEVAAETGGTVAGTLGTFIEHAAVSLLLRIRANATGEVIVMDLGQLANLAELWDMAIDGGMPFGDWRAQLLPFGSVPPAIWTGEAALAVAGVQPGDRAEPARPWRYGSSLFREKHDYVSLCGQVLQLVAGDGPDAPVMWTSAPAVQIDLPRTQQTLADKPLKVYGWLDSPIESQLIDEWAF